MFKVFKKQNETQLKKSFFIIAIFVIIWAAISIYLLKTDPEVLNNLTKPQWFPAIWMYDVLNYFPYIGLVVAFEFGALKTYRLKKNIPYLAAGIAIAMAVTEILAEYFFFQEMSFYVTAVMMILNVLVSIIMFHIIFRVSKIGAAFVVPYILLSSYTLYLLINIIQFNR